MRQHPALTAIAACSLLLTLGVAARIGAALPSDLTPTPPELSATIGRIAFVSYARDEAGVAGASALAESIRAFAGIWRDAPIYLYLDASVTSLDDRTARRLAASGVTTKSTTVPADMDQYPYAGKAFSAAEAERDLAGTCDVLVRLDPDTLVLQEPSALALSPRIAVGYVPVHQVLIASPVSQRPDAFWTEVYRVLNIPTAAAFPVATVLEHTQVRAYFNAGLVAVRPERAVFRGWRETFTRLASAPRIREMARQDQTRRMFLHQVALAGAVLSTVPRAQTLQLPASYNYPLSLFRAPDPLERFVTVRYENLLTTAGWSSRVSASGELLAWLRARFPH